MHILRPYSSRHKYAMVANGRQFQPSLEKNYGAQKSVKNINLLGKCCKIVSKNLANMPTKSVNL
jgi:hypothetical protein